MKVRVTQLNFRKDSTFDPKGLLDDICAKPYVVEVKKHWWNRWEYLMDDVSHCPKLFFGKSQLNAVLRDLGVVIND